MTYKQVLLTTQIGIHILFILGLFYFPVVDTIFAIVISQIIYVGLCGTLFFHRTVSHKNAIHPVAEKILLTLSWLGCVSSALAWAAVHRKHHRFSDTLKDPHSPILIGKFKTYWQMTNNDTDVIRYVPDLLKKPWYVFQHKNYFTVFFSIHILGLLFLSWYLYWALLVVPAFLMWFGGSMINLFCHDKNGPRNVVVLGLLNCGEGWHKNHHDQPGNSSFRHWSDWPGYLHHKLSIKND